MNIKFLLLSATLITAAQVLPAGAYEGPRYIFAPSIYAKGSQQNPQRLKSPYSVTAGSMPRSGILGINPTLLQPKPVAISVPTNSVQAVVSVPQIQTAPFNSDFGAPISEQKAAPTQMAMAKPAAAPHFISSHDGHAILKTSPHTTSQIARPAPLTPIQTYKPGVGYQAGSTVPAMSGGDQNTSTAVSGVIRGHH
jgi:hypothetical protein